jgi:hypothetical protein
MLYFNPEAYDTESSPNIFSSMYLFIHLLFIYLDIGFAAQAGLRLTIFLPQSLSAPPHQAIGGRGKRVVFLLCFVF